MNRKEPQLRRISSIESINKRKQEAPNIAPLGEISAEKIGRLFGQKTPERVIKTNQLQFQKTVHQKNNHLYRKGHLGLPMDQLLLFLYLS